MTNHNLGSRKIIKDVVIVGIVVLIIWICLTVIFGTANPFYVVASGSMLPTLEVNDVIVIESNTAFEDIKKSDIIVFFSPAKYEMYLKGESGGEERVIVHRVEVIVSEDPKIIKTRGDNNPRSMTGVDFPITEREYIGKVEYVIPQVGYITKILQPPVNYIIISIIIGVMVLKHFATKKQEVTFQHTLKSDETKSENHEIPDISLDKEYVDDKSWTEHDEHQASKMDDSNDTKSEDDRK